MKIICKQENLIKGLVIVSHLTGKNFNLPILNNILIKAEEGNIELSATNLELGVRTKIRGKIEKEGKITVPAKIITEYIGLMSNDKNITLEADDAGNLLINSENWNTKIKANSADDYPLIPEVENKKEIKVKINDFKNGLSQVLFAASFDETRPELTGVLFWFKDKNLTIAATDSYRLAEKKIQTEKEFKNEEKIIVPLKTMQEITRILGDEKEEYVCLFFDEHQFKISMNETVIVSRIIEGDYPDYKQIVPNNFNTQVEINTQETLKAIKAASIFTKTGIFDVTLNFLKENLVIRSINSQLGENTIKLKIENFGPEVPVVFNYKYLIDGLNNMNSSKTKVFINSSSNPVLFKPLQNKDDYMYLVMPIRQ